jgi:hypothetical protein
MNCAVWPSVRVMSGQIGCSVESELPSLWVKTSRTQYAYRIGIGSFRW